MTPTPFQPFTRVIALSTALAIASWAQSSTGTLLGTVVDPSGLTVPNAQARLISLVTGQRNQALSNQSGYFEFPFVAPGRYRVEISGAGFKTFARDEIIVSVNQRATLDIRLELGSASEIVEVSAITPLLDTESSSLGTVIGGRKTLDLPLNTRQVFGLALLASGITPGNGAGVGTTFNTAMNFSIDGAQRQSAKLVIDGIDATLNVSNPSFNGVTAIPSVDAVEEFKIQSNNFSAEYGRAAGGLITLVLKSGTNSYHGSLYEFLRNSKLDANSFFANLNGFPLPSFKRNQFGGTVGGPVVLPHVYNGRNRSFFFFSREALLSRTATTGTFRVPTERERSGDFSQTLNAGGAVIRVFDPASLIRNPDGSYTRQQFQGNVIPAARLNRVARNLLAYFPLENNPGAGPARQGNFFTTASSIFDQHRYDGKFDQIVGHGDHLSVKVSRYDNNIITPNYYGTKGGGGNIETVSTYTSGIEYTHTIRPNVIANVAAGFSRLENPRITDSEGFDVVSLGLPAAIDAVATHLTFPRVEPAGYAVLGSGPTDFQRPNFSLYQLRGAINTVHGGHSIKAGGEFQLRQVNDTSAGNTGTYQFDQTFTQGPDPLVPSQTAGNGFAALLLGAPSNGSLLLNPFVSTQSRNWALFLQDDVRVTPKLTLNLGLRWEVEQPRTERYNRQNFWDLNVNNPLGAQVGLPLKGGLQFAGVGGNPRAPYNTYWKNIGPRFGFAYKAPWQLVLRGGYGLFYGISPVGAAGPAGGNVAGFSSSTPLVGTLDSVTPFTSLDNPFPNGFLSPAGSSNGLLTQVGLSTTSVLRNARTAYMQQWNFNLQRLIPGKIVIETAYAGSHGLNLQLPVAFNYDQLPDQALQLGSKLLELVDNPFYGKIAVGALAQPRVQQRQLLLPYPQFASVSVAKYAVGQSVYHSFQLRAERRFSAGMTFLMSFTASKLITDADAGEGFLGPTGPYQDYTRFKLERSLSAVDAARRLVVSFSYELPWGAGKHWGSSWPAVLQGVFGRWQISGIATYQSGLPIGVTAPSVSQSVGAGTQRPNSVGRSALLSSSRSTDEKLKKWFDTTAFVQAANFTFGNVGRVLPDVRSDGVRNWDFAALKNFAIREDRIRLQARAEFFNGFNTVRFGVPNGVLNSATFGTVNAQANDPRQLQFGLRLTF